MFTQTALCPKVWNSLIVECGTTFYLLFRGEERLGRNVIMKIAGYAGKNANKIETGRKYFQNGGSHYRQRRKAC